MGKKTFAAAALLLAASSASAQSWYLGGGAGQSSVDIDSRSFETALASVGLTSSVSTRDRDTAFKVFGGYDFNRFFALEGGYARLGRAKVSAVVTAPVTGTAQVTFEGRAYYLDAIGSLPIIGGLSAFAKAGPALTTTKVTIAGLKIEEEEFNLKVGIGAKYVFSNGADLRLEWERYSSVGDPDTTSESDIDVIGLTIAAHF